MKRFHVHVAVRDLPESVRFYSKLFGARPAVEKPDYAKWMLDDPKVNFAISNRGEATGVNHLGIEVESEEELGQLREQAAAADIAALEQKDAACCYAKSDKYWVEDPQGVAWETFHTLGTVPVFGQDSRSDARKEACCIPLAKKSDAKEEGPCCVPTASAGSKAACCA
jgi:catechol 2,3-dioxygenase-like lactoylglutathione lyase family enzyme